MLVTTVLVMGTPLKARKTLQYPLELGLGLHCSAASHAVGCSDGVSGPLDVLCLVDTGFRSELNRVPFALSSHLLRDICDSSAASRVSKTTSRLSGETVLTNYSADLKRICYNHYFHRYPPHFHLIQGIESYGSRIRTQDVTENKEGKERKVFGSDKSAEARASEFRTDHSLI